MTDELGEQPAPADFADHFMQIQRMLSGETRSTWCEDPEPHASHLWDHPSGDRRWCETGYVTR